MLAALDVNYRDYKRIAFPLLKRPENRDPPSLH
jgi:hypothetical protein